MTVHGFTPAQNYEELYRAKLEGSGLTEEDGAALGFSLMHPEQTSREGFWGGKQVPALRIPYYHPLTGEPMRAAPEWPQVVRARVLVEIKDKDFPKYIQLPNTGNCAYFPRSPHVDWRMKLMDHTHDLLITEGELKAAKACREGYACIGLGGVYNFQGKNPRTDFLASLELVNWVRKAVYIAYDSDMARNYAVAIAAWRLAEILHARGAIVYLLFIPSSGDAKVGLDDFLVAHGTAGLDEIIKNSRQMTTIEALFKLNEEYAVLKEGDHEVVDLQECCKLRSSQLVYSSTKSVMELRPKKEGGFSNVMVNAAACWLEWPLRKMVRKLVYNPKQAPQALIENEAGSFDFNTWRGFAVAPIKGDVTPFLKLVDHLFTGALKEDVSWFLNWLAYPLIYPGTKILSAVVLHGLVHGSGKTLIGVTMSRIYGKAYTKITQKELTNNTHNEWAASKAFILGDDITGIDRYDIHDLLKNMITQNEVRINPKGVTAYELDDYANYLFTSNRANSFIIDDEDRRFFVWEVPKKIGKLPRQFYIDYMAWLDGPGPAALLYWFQQRDVSKFDPGDAPHETAAKRKMRQEARSDVENWVEDLRHDPDKVLVVNDIRMLGDLFTNEELRTAYKYQAGINDGNQDAQLAKRMGAALVAQGFSQVHKREPVNVPGRKLTRYYAIRNEDKWLKASLAEIQKHIKSSTVG